MLPILVMEEFDRALAQMVPLVNLVAEESFQAAGEADLYLQSLIHLAEQLSLPILADLSLIRARLMTYSPRDEMEEKGSRSGERKRKNRYILTCLEDANSCVKGYFSKDRKLLEESTILCRQLAAVGVAKGLVSEESMNQDQLMTLFRKEEELMPALTSSIGTVGYLNTAILLERAVELVKKA